MSGFRFSDGAGIPSRRDFTNASTIVVTHRFGFKPNVWIVINGIEVFGEVQYNNDLTFTVIFQTIETGVIYYR